MRLLVGGGTKTIRELLPKIAHAIGFLATPACGNAPATIRELGIPWAMDSGAFQQTGFDPRAFIRALDRWRCVPDCLFVAVPDQPMSADLTLRLWETWYPIVKARGLPAALVLQDGMVPRDIKWHELDWLFIGGSTEWKLSAVANRLVREGIRRGKRIHMGRVNSLTRLRVAYDWGCASVDGTGMARYGDTHLMRMIRSADYLDRQAVLWAQSDATRPDAGEDT